MVLLIVVNDEQAKNQQAREDAAEEFAYEMEVPKSSRQSASEQEGGGDDAPPAFNRVIRGEWLRGHDEFRALSGGGGGIGG